MISQKEKLQSIFFFQAEDGIRDGRVTGVQTCALPISSPGRTPGGALHDGGRAGVLPGDGRPRWREGGRWDPGLEAGDPVPRAGLRDARPRLDDARAVPDRRVEPAERRADADRQGTDRSVPEPRLLHARLV